VQKAEAEDRSPNDRKNFIIFRYPEKGPAETQHFLFTALLTLRKRVVEENREILIHVLNAIHTGIYLVSQKHVADEHVKMLIKRFDEDLKSPSLNLPTMEAKEALVRETLDYMHNLKIYRKTLIPDEAAFQNARQLWRVLRPQISSDAPQPIDKIPSLLPYLEVADDPVLQEMILARTPTQVLVDHPNVQNLFVASLADAQTQNAVIDQMPNETLESHPKVAAIVAHSVKKPGGTAVVQSPRTQYSRWDQFLTAAYGAPLSVCAFHFFIKLQQSPMIFFENLLFVCLAVPAIVAMPVLGVSMSAALQSANVRKVRWLAGCLYIGAVGIYVASYQVLKMSK